ncbi:MAG: hypothetical protein GVY12_01450 [Bacteroidetes bacterium]|jgi:hypothetical protein|nr:hypothetical protein [Bacteroidota bacterium]
MAATDATADVGQLAERILEKSPPDLELPRGGLVLRDPLLWRLLGVPALPAYRDAYVVAQRIDRGCKQSVKGYMDGLRAARAGGHHE